MVVPVLSNVLACSEDGAAPLLIYLDGYIAPMILLSLVFHTFPKCDFFLEGPLMGVGCVPDDGNPFPHQELLFHLQNRSHVFPVLRSLNRNRSTSSRLGMLFAWQCITTVQIRTNLSLACHFVLIYIAVFLYCQKCTS